MRIEKEDYKNFELIIDTYYYPKETIVYELDKDTDQMVPSFMRVIDSVPNPGRKLSIEVVENGYVISSGKRTIVSPNSGYDDRLENVIPRFLNHDIESERPLTEHELEDSDEFTEKMNNAYEETKV